MKNSLNYLLKDLLKKNGIKVDEKELEFQLQSHPSYPSLHSLTGVLDHFKINNVAIEVPNSKETLNQLPKTFIAYIKNETSDDLVQVNNSVESVQLVYDDKRKKKLSFNEFLKIWTGIIVVVEKDKETEAGTKMGRKIFNLLNVNVFVTLIVMLALFFSLKPSLFQALHFILSFVGLVTSIVIVKHELGFHSKIADKFCSGNIKKVNCDNVLNSKAATFLGIFKLSSLGIVYFFSLILLWIILIISNINYGILVLMTVLAVPFTFYSIFYQYFKVKNWCLLCLSIVIVLWLQAGTLYFEGFENLLNLQIVKTSMGLHNILPIAAVFLFSSVLWSILLPRLKKEQELIKLRIEHYKFKRNYSLFDALISRKNPINTEINNFEEVSFGSKNCALQIVIVTNPLCSLCREVHKLVKDILRMNNKEVQIIIRFNISLKPDLADTKISLRILELFNEEGRRKFLEAMHDIYGKMTPEKWLKKWNEVGDQKYMEVLNEEKQWCKNNMINFTPEILVNGRPFPVEYSRGDLIYFIDDIIEEVEQDMEVKVSESEDVKA